MRFVEKPTPMPKQETEPTNDEEINLDRIFRYSEIGPKKKEPKVIYRAQALNIPGNNRYFEDGISNSISPMQNYSSQKR